MSALQKLLDDKWPIRLGMADQMLLHNQIARNAFTEGYTMAREESKRVVQEMLDGPSNGKQFDKVLIGHGYNIALQDVKATLYTV